MKTKAALCILAFSSSVAIAAELTVTMSLAEKQGNGQILGTLKIVETPYGLAFYPALKGLSPGIHGFHVHQNPSCAPIEKDGVAVPALGAGDHLDPQDTKRHGEPWGDGHLGDLPPLVVAADSTAMTPVLAPRLKLADIVNRSIIIHSGGDNHSDHPMPLGGGGSRIACGVVGA